MKTKYIFASLLSASLAVTGCQEMDTLPEGGLATDSQKETIVSQLPERAEAQVNAIFSTFNTAFPNAGALGSERHNDIGFPTIIMALDTNGEDIVSANNGYNWTGYDLDWQDRDNTMNECRMVWNNLYSIVFAANNITASIPADTKDPQQQMYLGQAVGARGFAYLIMAQIYQFNYKTAADKVCVPIITEKNREVASVDGCTASTVKEVYAQVKADLDEAINLLTAAKAAKVTPKNKRYISLGVAYGLRARMNLAMGDLNAAGNDAIAAIKESEANGLAIMPLSEVGKPSFSDMSESNWMWGILVEETDDVVGTGICNFPSHMGSLCYGYANYSGGRQISKKLYAQIKAGDYRLGWWLKDTGGSVGEAATLPDNMGSALTDDAIAYVNEMAYIPLTQVKFAPYQDKVGNSINAQDIPLMRLEEMYLIAAEAGHPDYFKKFVDNRANAASATEYMNAYNTNKTEAVYFQRRVELWGEGLIWFDIMRLGKGVDRTDCGFPAEVEYVIQPTDEIMLWRIPEAEIEANKALKGQSGILGSGKKPEAGKE